MSSPITPVLSAVAPSLAIALVIATGVSLIRWAKKGGRSAALLGSALVLLLGSGLVPDPPQQRIEEAREDKGKKGAESGDPPNS